MHDHMTYNCLLAGHTKFMPDRCCSLIKQNYCSGLVSSIFDVATAVNNPAGVNSAQLCGLPHGEVLIPVHDWQNVFVKCFRCIPDRLSYHRFKFSIVCSKYMGSEPKGVEVFGDSTIPPGSPEKIAPAGLSEQRKNINLGKQKLVKK